MTAKEQTRRSKTCIHALGELQMYAIKTTTGCPYAYPVMGTLSQGSFYAVEKCKCKNCESYVPDEDRLKEYKDSKKKYEKTRPRVKGQKTEYTW